MDDHFPVEAGQRPGYTTRGAEGLARRYFSTADVKAMATAGVFHPEERFELLGGEFVPMNAKNNGHEVWKRKLAMRWSATLFGGPLDLAVETSLYLSDGFIFEPGILIHDSAIQPEDVRGPDCRLLVEIADTSLAYDLRDKSTAYARHGVLEYWVLNTQRRRAHMFSEPAPDGNWGQSRELGEADRLIPRELADLAVKLTDLDL